MPSTETDNFNYHSFNNYNNLNRNINNTKNNKFAKLEMDYQCLQEDYKELSKNYKKDIKKIADINEARLKSLQEIIANKTEECESINAQLKNYKKKYNTDYLEWKQTKTRLENELKKNQYSLALEYENEYNEKLDVLQEELKSKTEEINSKEEKILYFNKMLARK